MADNLRWWKLWTTAPSDSKILSLTPATRWAWAALGAHTTAQGVPQDDLRRVLDMLPNVRVEESQKCPGYLAVTWSNWRKYQQDITQSERRRASRLKRRGEEKRGDEKRTTPKPPALPAKPERMIDLGFAAFWQSYPRKRAKGDALKAWKALKPDGSLCQVIARAVASQRRSEDWTRDAGRFIPYPATWLRSRRWEDAPEGPERKTVAERIQEWGLKDE